MTDTSAIVQDSDLGTTATTATVDIIIVNWNSGDQLGECLRSIADWGSSAVRRVFVVDNASTDGSIDVAPPPQIDVDVIFAGENLGFGRACNLAAARAEAPFLLFLNPDAELREAAIPTALAHLAAPAHRRTGVVGIKLVGRGGDVHRHCARFPTWRNFIGNSLGLTRVARRWFAPITMIEFDHLSSRSVDHVMGAFYLIRRDLFASLRGFDEDFFVYLEDLDLSRRVVDSGAEIVYLADVESYHKQGGTSEQVKAHRLFYALQSNIIYAFKHLPRAHAWGIAAVTLLVEPFSRLVRATARRSLDEFRFTLQGFAMLYAALPNIVRTLRGGRGARG